MRNSDLDILHGLTEEHLHCLLSRTVYQRAENYYHDRRVSHPQRTGAMLKAHVQGTDLYTVRIEITNGIILSSCTCPSAQTNFCKHAGAVLLQWIREPESFAVTDKENPMAITQAKGAFPSQSSSHPNNHHSRYERSIANPVTSMDSGERDLGLQTLLQRLPLADLREIAWQRGWRLKGNNKADFAVMLASLLVDPTEVARAVITLPEPLREALRAAFVAEEGGGITPTTLAYVINALRKEKELLKPVEAAGLLLDLSRWGLLIPWRDSLNGIQRYLFPWEIQRHVPPLLGWCAQSPEAPSTQTLSCESRDFLQLLFDVWNRISLEPPKLRPSCELSSGTHLLTASPSYLSKAKKAKGWPRESARTDWAGQTLPVTPPPFLLDEAGLSALSLLTDGDIEQLEFVCHLLCELDLVSTEKGYLLAQPQMMEQFLRRSTVEQYMAVAKAYLSVSDWNELDLLLRTHTNLIAWRNAYFLSSYSQFRSHLVRLRHMLLRFLATAGEEGWCTFTDVEVALRSLWLLVSGMFGIKDHPWIFQAWGLAWRKDEILSSIDETQNLQITPAYLLRIMLEGPLYWLGFAKLCHQQGELAAFRLHGLADLMWDRPILGIQEKSFDKAGMVDEVNQTITVHPGLVSPQTHALLGRIAYLTEATSSRFVYHLDMRRAQLTFERGISLSDLLTEWEEVMPFPIPQTMRETLHDWWARYGQVHLYEGLALLELGDEVTLQELEASTSLSKYIITKLSPRLVVVPDEAVDALLNEFISKGYIPKEIRNETRYITNERHAI